jgi:hypothetical protein
MEVKRTEARLARVQRGWQEGVHDDDDYRGQRAGVLGELDGARTAHGRAAEHVQALERTGAVTDAEEALLRQMAAIKQAVADGAGRAPDVDALRNKIGEMFEAVELLEYDPNGPNPFRQLAGKVKAGLPDKAGDLDIHGYFLRPHLRWSPDDLNTPVRQIELPATSAHYGFS